MRRRSWGHVTTVFCPDFLHPTSSLYRVVMTLILCGELNAFGFTSAEAATTPTISLCSGSTYTSAVTIELDPTITDQTYTLDNCAYLGDLTITGTTAGPLTNVSVFVTQCSASSVVLDAKLHLHTGSQLLVSGITATSNLYLYSTVSGGASIDISTATVTGNIVATLVLSEGSNVNIRSSAARSFGWSGGNITSSTFAIDDLKLQSATSITINSNANATFIVNRTYTTQVTIAGAFNSGSSLLDQSTVENKLASVQKTFVNTAIFTGALLEVRRSTILTVDRIAMYMNAHVMSGGVHRLVDNVIKTTYTVTIGSGNHPRQGAITYVADRYFSGGCTLEMSGNDVYVGTKNAYGLYTRMSGGRIVHDGRNKYTSGSIYVSHIWSTHDNLFVVNQSSDLNKIEYSQTSVSSDQPSTGDAIGIYTLDAAAVEIAFTFCKNVTVDSSGASISMQLINLGESTGVTVNVCGITGGSLSVLSSNSTYLAAAVSDCRYTASLAFRLTIETSLVIVNRTSSGWFINTGAYGTGSSLLMDQSTANNKDMTIQYAFYNEAVFTDALLEVRRSTIVTAYRYAMYMNAHVESGGVHRLVDNVIKMNYAPTAMTGPKPQLAAIAYVPGKFFYGGCTLEMSGNDVFVRSSLAHGLYVCMSGGRIVHDGRNKYTSGSIYVSHIRSTHDNLFVVNQSSDLNKIEYSQTSVSSDQPSTGDAIGIYNLQRAVTVSVSTEAATNLTVDSYNTVVSTFIVSSPVVSGYIRIRKLVGSYVSIAGSMSGGAIEVSSSTCRMILQSSLSSGAVMFVTNNTVLGTTASLLTVSGLYDEGCHLTMPTTPSLRTRMEIVSI